MSALTVRRLLIDLGDGFPRHWHGGDPFRSALFDALSMSFPVGEQFFIDSVKKGVAALDAGTRERFADDLKGFVGQEATHRHIHGIFNAQLESQGYTNTWQERAARRIGYIAALDARHQVAITAAYEHYTAILADWLLANEAQMTGVDARLKAMWLWHSVEESEHKSVAFDVYQALGGTPSWRIRWFLRCSFFFFTDLFRQTARNLWHDGELFRLRTLRSCLSFLFGRHGMVPHTIRPWRAYFRRDFHPSQLDSSPLTTAWLSRNGDAFKVVGAT
jgi:predicted metal-dependent hydrolase